MTLDRRTFLGAIAVSGASFMVPSTTGAEPPDRVAPEPADHFPRQDPELVQRVVGASHRDYEAVRELVGKRPELAKAQWDWGFGDWESALGAASHTGRREIAELLLAHGARPNLFSATMLGELAVVKAFVDAFPGVQGIPGPHGIPLLAHAHAGGEPAAAVAEYLERVGGADGPVPVPLDDAQRNRFVGSYRFGSGVRDQLDVTVGPRGLSIGRPDETVRSLVYVGDLSFHPAGAPSVRVRFEADRGLGDGSPPVATALTIHDPDLQVRALRTR